jgi:hypothetical protein
MPLIGEIAMKSISIYCSLLALVSIYATCNKGNCHEAIYSFEATYSIFPDKDSIQIGDTIWLQLSTLTTLNSLFTNQVVDYSGAVNFGTAVGYAKLIGGDMYNPGSVPAADSFNYKLIKGINQQSAKQDQVRNFLFVEENGMYVFKLGIIPKAKGLFALGPGNAVNVYTNKNKCDKANFNLTFKNTNQHLYFLEQSRPGYETSIYEKTHMYCVKVY